MTEHNQSGGGSGIPVVEKSHIERFAANEQYDEGALADELDELEAEEKRILAMTEEELIAEAGGPEAYAKEVVAGERAVHLAMLRFHIASVLIEKGWQGEDGRDVLSKAIAGRVFDYFNSILRQESSGWQPIETAPKRELITPEDILIPVAAHLFRSAAGCEDGISPFDIQRGGNADFNGKPIWEHCRKDAEPLAVSVFKWLKDHGKIGSIEGENFPKAYALPAPPESEAL